MKDKPSEKLESYRRKHGTLGDSEGMYGYFFIHGQGLNVISSGKHPHWEHVSVSMPRRCPTWNQMCIVKDLFWELDETVIQFHPKGNEYVNIHTYTLHLWKKTGEDHELPPTIYV